MTSDATRPASLSNRPVSQSSQPSTNGSSEKPVLTVLTFSLLLFALVIGSDLALAIWLFGSQGANEMTALLFARYTARVSFLFFLPVFSIHAVNSLLPTRTGQMLMRKRRQLGLAFALAHSIHLAGIIFYFSLADYWFTASDIPALTIYCLIGLMAITSNSLSVRRLKSGWKVLHRIGLYGVFTGFFVTYLGRVQGYDTAQTDPLLKESFSVYVVLLIAISTAWLLRITAWWKPKLFG